VSGPVQENFPLSKVTSFRIGGPADAVVEPGSEAELAAVLRYVDEHNLPWVILGAGTNVLVGDSGFRGVVVRTTGLTGFEIEPDDPARARVVCEAGVRLASVVARTCREGLTGLEPLWGIPGTFGGAVVCNAGAGGACIADFLTEIRILNDRGALVPLHRGDFRYGYRSIELPGRSVVLGGTLRLRHGEPDAIRIALVKAKMARMESQPWDRPSAGCVFKNPSPERPAGAIIDGLGLKGMTVGDAEVSEVHANFIINRGDASAADVLALVEAVRSRVRQAEHVDLELEIRLMGERRPHDE